MQIIKLFFIFSACIFIISCSGASGKTGSSGRASGSNTGSGASWSALIDGKSVSGITASTVNRINLDDNNKVPGLGFQVGLTNGMKLGFEFLIRSTNTTELRYRNNMTVCNYHTAEGVTYIVDSGTVTLDPGAAPRTAGTFSGRWKSVSGENTVSGAAIINITNGKFDLP